MVDAIISVAFQLCELSQVVMVILQHRCAQHVAWLLAHYSDQHVNLFLRMQGTQYTMLLVTRWDCSACEKCQLPTCSLHSFTAGVCLPFVPGLPASCLDTTVGVTCGAVRRRKS